MKTRKFGMGFFGRMPFGADPRKAMAEKWSKMTDAEKLKFMNKRMKRMESMNGKNGHEDCGKREMTVEAIDKCCQEWMSKTPEEKESFIKERMEAVHNHFSKGFGRHEMTVEAFDQRCQEWMSKTIEEKEVLIKERMEAIHHHFGKRFGCGHEGFFGGHEMTVEAFDQRCQEWMSKTTEGKEALIKQRMETIHSHMGERFGSRHNFGFGDFCEE